MKEKYTLRQVVDSAGGKHTYIIYPDGTKMETGYSLTKFGAKFNARQARRRIKRLLKGKDRDGWMPGPGWNGKEWVMEYREEHYELP